jgi:hypothetical protein
MHVLTNSMDGSMHDERSEAPARGRNEQVRLLLQLRDLLVPAGTPVDTDTPQPKQLLQGRGCLLNLT